MALPRLALKEIAQVALQTYLRFPFTLLCAAVGTTAVWGLIGEKRDAFHHILTKIAITSALGLILFFVLELLAERKSNRPGWRWGFIALGVLLVVGYYFLLPDVPHLKEVSRYLLFMLALHLAASFAAFLNWRTENGFWQFNKSLFLRLLTAGLYSGVLFVGLVLAILAFDQLFDMDINERIYPRLWFFMVGIFNTWFFLAGVPDPTKLEETTDYPKGLKLFTQFVLLPLVTLYLLILYGYLAKILLQWEWPRGWVSYLVLGFSTAGIFSLLLIHPIRFTQGNRWMRTYAKWFYRALFPLLVLLLLAIWRRVRDYGITENRYFVLALALWLLAVALYFLFSKQKNIKFIPMTLAAVAFFSAFGPWGAFAVSQRSQTARLQQLLTQHGLLVNGHVRKTTKPISARAEFEIGSIVSYLGEVHRYESVRPWFGKPLDSLFQAQPEHVSYAPSGWEVMELIGLELRYSPVEQEQSYFHIQAKNTQVQSIGGFDFLIEVSEAFWKENRIVVEHELGKEKITLILSRDRNDIQIIYSGETLQLPLDSLLQNNKRRDNEVAASTMLFPVEGKQLKAALQVTGLSVEKENGKFRLQNLQGRLLVKFK
ncbi:MAG: DUF4153 domain-containing protein [Rufibacter sp.]